MAEKLQHLQGGRGTAERPSSRKATGPITQANLIRNALTTKTWMALGAALQLVLFALPVRRYVVALPVVAYLTMEVVGTLLVMAGVRADPQRAGVLDTKYTALVPDAQGNFRSGRDGQGLAIFFLGFRCSHHLGALAPGFKHIGVSANGMLTELEAQADAYGFLGSTLYHNMSSMRKGTDLTFVMHFRSNADVLRYAQSPLHRQAWDWFNRHTKQYPHLGIMHELYEVPAGKWESIYKNTAPALLAKTQHRVVDAEGNATWVSPLIEASRGKLSSSAGRLG